MSLNMAVSYKGVPIKKKTCSYNKFIYQSTTTPVNKKYIVNISYYLKYVCIDVGTSSPAYPLNRESVHKTFYIIYNPLA